MKKLFMFCSSIFISAFVSAQITDVNNFCKVLSKVMANASDNFRKIQIGDNYLNFYSLAGNFIGEGWKTSVNFPGAIITHINRNEYLNNPYTAHFGSFKKFTDATKKLNSIKGQLTTCVKGYKVKVEKNEPSSPWLFPIRYEYIREEGNLTQQIMLFINKSTEHLYYHVTLQVQGMNPLVLKSKGDQELEDLFGKWPALNFDTTSVSPAQTKLAKQLQQLLDYAKDGFKAIKGEEIIKKYSKELINDSWGEKIYSRFKTGFLPEVAEKSEVRYYPNDKTTKFIASYDYLLWPESTFRELFAKMKKELGNDFIVEVDEQSINKNNYVRSQKAVFYLKGSKLPQIQLIYNTDLDTITTGMPPGILIVVEALKNQSTVADNKPVTKDITGNETILKIWQNDEGKGDQNKLAKQLNKFNEQLSSIVADYANNFATIKGERKTALFHRDEFYSKVELQGADSVYLTENWTTRRLDFTAVYSSYSSKEEAREKFNELVAQVDKCKFPCCTFAKADVSEHSNMVVQGWLPFDLFRKMEPTYANILLEVEIGERIDLVTKSGKFDMEESWQLVLRVKKL